MCGGGGVVSVNVITVMPKQKPAMTEFSTETAASWRVPTWPAKT